jgi:hypothetical protein
MLQRFHGNYEVGSLSISKGVSQHCRAGINKNPVRHAENWVDCSYQEDYLKKAFSAMNSRSEGSVDHRQQVHTDQIFHYSSSMFRSAF